MFSVDVPLTNFHEKQQNQSTKLIKIQNGEKYLLGTSIITFRVHRFSMLESNIQRTIKKSILNLTINMSF